MIQELAAAAAFSSSAQRVQVAQLPDQPVVLNAHAAFVFERILQHWLSYSPIIVMPRGYNNDRISKNFPHPHALHKDLAQREPYTKQLNRSLAVQRANELAYTNEMRPVIDFTRLGALFLPRF